MLTADTFHMDTFLHETHREEQHAAHLDHMKPIRQPRPSTDWRTGIARSAKAGIAARGTRLNYLHLYVASTDRR